MNFGMDGTFAWVVGLLMCGNALLNFLILMCHPEFRSGAMSANMDPTARYGLASEEASQLLAQNPQYAVKAGQFAMQQAQQNPQMTTSFVSPSGASGANASRGYVPPSPVKI